MPESKQKSTHHNLLAESANRRSGSSVNAYTRAVRRKLYFLFGMLLLVIVLMKEARKPERWMWMGFNADGSAPTSPIQLDAFQSPVVADDQLANDTVDAGIIPGATQPPNPNSPDDNSRSDQDRFWKTVWNSIDQEDKSILVQLIQLSQKPLLDRQADSFEFNSIMKSLSEIDIEKEAGQPFASDWTSKILPGLKAIALGNDISIGQQQRIGEIFKSIDPLILGEIDDFTSPGRTSDLPAWHRFWGSILNPSNVPSGSTESVSPVQLIAQPDQWRFKPIRISGRLLSGRKMKVGPHGPLKNEEAWYEWWIGNTHGADEVWCLYTAHKPDGLSVTEQFTDFDLKIETNGYFYKVRSYIDTTSVANHCPLVLANTLSINKVSNPIAEATWKPTTPVIIAVVLGAIVVAFGIAMLIHRSDRITVHSISEQRDEMIGEDLNKLSSEIEIRSTKERLEDLS